jgi:hypothetical protein
MSAARANLTATRLGNGRVLVVGGAGVTTAEAYDPPTGTWIPAGTLNEPRGLHVAVRLADGRADREPEPQLGQASFGVGSSMS